MYSPARLLFIVITAVFAAELLVMSVLPMLPPHSRWEENTLDAFLLLVLLFPVLYFRLFRPLRRLNEELEARTRDAESANQAKSAFMANISHEIRTPLHVLIGISHLMRRNPDAPVQMQRLNQICATSEHLLGLVNDILDLSKIEAGRFMLDDSEFRVGAVIEQVHEVVGELVRDKNLVLVTDVFPSTLDLVVRGDALRLSQVLINLAGNAVKFSHEGAICLAACAREEGEDKLRLRFAVRDAGIGIAPEDQARLFQPFEQLDSSITREHGGSGLGLAISQRLVALMGGSIRVDSRPGAGSTFSFEIVLQRGSKVAASGAALVAEPDIAGARILVAEDHPLSQEIILEMLEDLGCHADIATDGLDAVACAGAQPYDLILMDMQMPKMDGLAAARAIRKLSGYGATPIIALTANAFVEDRQRCQDAGMNAHLSKPVTSEKLVAVLSQWLPDMALRQQTAQAAENELGAALARIAGLEIGPSWKRSADRLRDYRSLLERFVQQHGGDMALLRDHLAAGEESAAHKLAHNLKGISGLIGARQVEMLATELVHGLRAGADSASLAALVAACEAELMRLTAAVRALTPPASTA